MNKNCKPSNYSFHEHYHLLGYLSSIMIEELLDLVDDIEDTIPSLESTIRGLEDDVRYWKSITDDE